MKIPKDLINSINEGNCVLFLGAGVSIDAGIPGWKELIEPLRHNLLDCSKHDDLLEVAQVYENINGRAKLNKHLRKHIYTRKKPSIIHELLTNIGISTIVTTNYDVLLERVIEAKKKSCAIIVEGCDFVNSGGKDYTLYKMHGSIENPQSIIITKKDYLTYRDSHDALCKSLAVFMQANNFLFIGYSLKDINFMFLLGDVLSYQADRVPNSYAVLCNTREFERNSLNTMKIEVIDVKTGKGNISDCLIDFINQLYFVIKSTKEDFYPSDKAKKRVPAEVSKKALKDNFKLVGCREYAPHNSKIESGLPDYVPLEFEDFSNEEFGNIRKSFYRRKDNKCGDISGVAYFKRENCKEK